MSALLLVVCAGLLHALWNVAAKKAGGDDRFALWTVLITVVLWAPVAAWVGLGSLAQVDAWAWCVLSASAAVHVLYFTALLKGYRVSDLTVVYPVARGSGPLLASIGAVLLLGERMSAVAALGVAAVCLGVFCVAGGPGLLGAHPGRDPLAAARVRAGLRWGALTGALIAAYTVIDGYAVKVLLISPVLVDYVGNVLRVPLLAPAAWRDPAAFVQAGRNLWRHALVVAVLGPLAYILVLTAVTLAPLSHVAPAREISMLFAALIGGRLLGEGDRGWRLAGAGLMAAGVAGLALG